MIFFIEEFELRLETDNNRNPGRSPVRNEERTDVEDGPRPEQCLKDDEDRPSLKQDRTNRNGNRLGLRSARIDIGEEERDVCSPVLRFLKPVPNQELERNLNTEQSRSSLSFYFHTWFLSV